MKKAFAIILCVILLASFPLRSAPAHAITPGLMITGSTIINSAAMTTILSIVAQTMGLDGNIKQAMEASQQNAVTAYLGGLLSEYATRVGSTVGAFYTIINEGMKYASNGALTFDDAASQFLGDFWSWAHSEDGGNLQQYDSVEVGNNSEVVNGGGVNVITPFPVGAAGEYVESTGQRYTYYFVGDGGLFLFYGRNLSSVRFLYASESSQSSCQRVTYSYSGDLVSRNNFVVNHQYTYDGKTVYYFDTGTLSGGTFTYPGFFQVSDIIQGEYAWAMIYGDISGDSNVDTNIFDFPENEPNYDTNVIYPGDIISLPDFGSGSTGTADIGSYLGAVSDVIYSGAGSLSVEDSQGVTTDYSVSSSGVESMQHVQAASATVDQVIGGSTTAVGSGTVQGELADFTLDLRDFFPFCIPFDIYRMLSLFAASREAPHVEWRFLVPGIVDETIEIDFSVFDNVAATLRSVELIAAAIGLALITKRLIQGGD